MSSAPGVPVPGFGGGAGAFELLLLGAYEFEGFVGHISDNVVPNVEQIADNIPIFEAAKAYRAAQKSQ